MIDEGLNSGEHCRKAMRGKREGAYTEVLFELKTEVRHLMMMFNIRNLIPIHISIAIPSCSLWKTVTVHCLGERPENREKDTVDISRAVLCPLQLVWMFAYI